MKDSIRWYNQEGKIVSEVPNISKGGMRSVTVKDARKMGLVPSCTTILGILAKPELDRWKQNQVLLAALTLPKKPEESEEIWCERIIEDAFKQVDDAANLGTSIHAAIEAYFQGQRYDRSLQLYVDLVKGWVEKHKITFIKHELKLVDTADGWAGTTDCLFTMEGKPGTYIGDFKSRKSKPEYPMKPWSTEPMQIAAYAHNQGAIGGVNIYLSTTEPGRMEDCWYDQERIEKEYEAFRHANALFRHLKNL